MEYPRPLPAEELARQRAFYLATSCRNSWDNRTIEDLIKAAQKIDAYLKGETDQAE